MTEGLAMLAGLDLQDHVPDEREVDLGDTDPGVTPLAGKGQAHVGLGFAAKVDGAVVDLVRYRARELDIAGEIRLAFDYVHGKARHAHLLPPRGSSRASSAFDSSRGTWWAGE